jgi:hypothetical protein
MKYFIVLYLTGITNKKVAIDLLKRSKIVLFISLLYIYSITIGCFALIILTFGMNLSLHDFLLYGIPWIIIWTVWSYIACSIAYWLAAYYIIICFYLKSRLNSIRIKVKILKEHNDLCVKMNNYNNYWKKYLSITILIYIIAICFLLYLVFFPPMIWYLRFEFVIVLSAHILLVVVFTYFASSISHFNYVLYRDLNSIYFNLNLRIDMKLKVSFEIEKRQKKIFGHIFLLQLMNYIEKVGNNKIGFTFINDSLIKRSTFQIVSQF